MPDGFSDPGANGAVANGAYISVAGSPPISLKGAGATFVKSFGKQIGTTPNPYAAYGAQAMLRDAPGRRRRAAATARRRRRRSSASTITNGILGNFTINAAGDTNLTPITIYKQAGKNLKPLKTIIPAASLIG